MTANPVAFRIPFTAHHTIDANTTEGKAAAQIVFELLLNTPTDFWK